MKRIIFLLCMVLLLATGTSFSQEEKEESQQQETIKTGWTFGALPTITFDSDLGFQYGALVNLYNYGDGSRYPQFDHSLYFEVSRFTKGSGINRFFFDSDKLIKGLRTTVDVSFITDKALDFYGFNGYESKYNSAWEDDEGDDYETRVFYKHERKMFRFKSDLQGNLSGEKVLWLAGFTYYNFDVGPVDINNLNEGKDDEDKLPDVDGLYDRYVTWGIITDKEKNGGSLTYLKFGIAFDTRDNEPNPMSGVWTEAVLQTAPSFLGNNDWPHTKISITHRQYFTLIKNDLSFAYRVGYQGTISGDPPFFAQPLMITSILRGASSQGLGGSKSLRGILRNRIVGDGFVYGNLELRWKFLRDKFLNQNIYLALNTFVDGGKVISPIEFDTSLVPSEEYDDYFNQEKDGLHLCYGAGLRIAMNQNFIVACDFGKTTNAEDGNTGLYIGLNYLF
ncbi:MAG: BamA/TamA family outer membrane protein [Bacteroidetes bacterium]|nr:BamA/TamA family outer membrane protein [Bacteroidota bacterium]